MVLSARAAVAASYRHATLAGADRLPQALRENVPAVDAAPRLSPQPRPAPGAAGIAARALRLGLLLLAMGGPALAQAPAPPGMSPDEAASRRFPQPVRVGDLLHRAVLQPLESQPVLGHVDAVIRQADGRIAVIVQYGGFLTRFGLPFSLGSRPIAVPVEAMTVVGDVMDIVDLKPAELDQLPTLGETGIALAPDDTIRVGLARPSH